MGNDIITIIVVHAFGFTLGTIIFRFLVSKNLQEFAKLLEENQKSFSSGVDKQLNPIQQYIESLEGEVKNLRDISTLCYKNLEALTKKYILLNQLYKELKEKSEATNEKKS